MQGIEFKTKEEYIEWFREQHRIEAAKCKEIAVAHLLKADMLEEDIVQEFIDALQEQVELVKQKISSIEQDTINVVNSNDIEWLRERMLSVCDNARSKEQGNLEKLESRIQELESDW